MAQRRRAPRRPPEDMNAPIEVGWFSKESKLMGKSQVPFMDFLMGRARETSGPITPVTDGGTLQPVARRDSQPRSL
jgi:hypothetical protein